MNLTPIQLHLIAYTNLLSSCVRYWKYLNLTPTLDDIVFFFNLKHQEKTSPSFLYLEAVHSRKIVEGIPSMLGDAVDAWFFININWDVPAVGLNVVMSRHGPKEECSKIVLTSYH